MNYDTGITDPVLYSLFTQDKILSILQDFAKNNLSCKVLLGVPTYDKAPRHDVGAENVTSAIRGLLAAIGAKNAPAKNLSGIAIYAFWTTSAAEWKEFSDGWLGTPRL